MGDASAEIRLVAWIEADLGLLRRQNTPEMTEHLGGPETEEKILGRHRRYLRLADSGAGEMFAIALDGERVGSVGYWERSWHDELVYEVGWNVVSAFQGRGIATVAAKAAAERAKARHRHKHLHACPAPSDPFLLVIRVGIVVVALIIATFFVWDSYSSRRETRAPSGLWR